jgi:hypothetical protein
VAEQLPTADKNPNKPVKKEELFVKTTPLLSNIVTAQPE